MSDQKGEKRRNGTLSAITFLWGFRAVCEVREWVIGGAVLIIFNLE